MKSNKYLSLLRRKCSIADQAGWIITGFQFSFKPWFHSFTCQFRDISIFILYWISKQQETVLNESVEKKYSHICVASIHPQFSLRCIRMCWNFNFYPWKIFIYSIVHYGETRVPFSSYICSLFVRLFVCLFVCFLVNSRHTRIYAFI